MKVSILLSSLLILCFCCTIGSAQVSGYMGNRLSVDYSFSLMKNYLGYDHKLRKVGKGWTYNQDVSLNYAVGRRVEMGVNYGFFKTGIRSGTDYGKISATALGLHYILFRNRIGHHGQYFRFNVQIISATYWAHNESLILNGDSPDYGAKGKFVRVGYAVGDRIILFKRLIINVGIRSGFVINTAGMKTESGQFFRSGNIRERLGYFQLVQGYIGLGFLLF